MITKEDIQKRLAMLEQDYERAIADVNAINGAMQDCKHWLEQLTKDEPTDESKQENVT
jgi:hypothetical protein